MHEKECQIFFVIDAIIFHVFILWITMVESTCRNSNFDKADPTCRKAKIFVQVLNMILWFGWFIICFSCCTLLWLFTLSYETRVK